MNQNDSAIRACLPHVANAWRRTAIAALPLGVLLSACDVERCPGPDVVYDPQYAVCSPVSPGSEPDAPEDTGSADAGELDSAVDPDSMDSDSVPFGADCEDDSDCNGGVCVNEPLPLGCTQEHCKPGEPNENVCPPDWMCLDGTRGSGCVKF
ncbi:MAG: hypothetical protein OXU20_40025 [Myxococcales bacterium]|nr:hypothetical protein [Myxococcales bacterium]